jgi:hypothetical protein
MMGPEVDLLDEAIEPRTVVAALARLPGGTLSIA